MSQFLLPQKLNCFSQLCGERSLLSPNVGGRVCWLFVHVSKMYEKYLVVALGRILLALPSGRTNASQVNVAFRKEGHVSSRGCSRHNQPNTAMLAGILIICIGSS